MGPSINVKYPDILTVVYVSFQTTMLKDAEDVIAVWPNFQIFNLCFK